MKPVLIAIALTLAASVASADATDAQLLNCDRITNNDTAKLTCFEALVPAPIDISGMGIWEISSGIIRTSRKEWSAITVQGTGGDHFPYDPPLLVINCVGGNQGFYFSYDGDPSSFTAFTFYWDFDGVRNRGYFTDDGRGDVMYMRDEDRTALLDNMANHTALQIEWLNYADETKYVEFDLRGMAAAVEASANECWDAGEFSRPAPQ